MKLYSLEDTILTLAKNYEGMGDVHRGDVYYFSEKEDVVYPAFNLLTNNIYHNVDEYTKTYNLTLFCFDRLTNDRENIADCQSQAIQALQTIIYWLIDEGNCEVTNITFTPFEQRFNDLCAGAFAYCNVVIPVSECGDEEFVITPANLKKLTVNRNGVYKAEAGSGFDSVTVNVPEPKYYHEDVDDETNAQLNVNNNVVQVNRDGIEIYEKGGNRVNIDYDGVCVFTEVGAKLTWNDARVLTICRRVVLPAPLGPTIDTNS